MAVQRSEQLFAEIVQRHQAPAYRLAHALLESEADARDVSQQAFVRLFKSHKPEDGAYPSTGFYRLLVGLCISRKRRGKGLRKLLPFGSSGYDPDQPGIEQGGAKDEFSGGLEQALKHLSANQRVAVLLPVQERFSSRELAEVLNCSENAARVHMYRGMTALEKLVGMNSDAGCPS
jgi:RNA polymerase sigma-70 factor (ECF subfamily)